MAGNYEQLRDLINNPTQHGIPAWDNDENLLSGLNIKNYFLSVINSLTAGYQFMGVAASDTEGGTPDQNVFYLAGAGTYTGFGSDSIVINAGYIGVIRWNGSWSYATIQVGGSYTLPIATAQTLGGVKIGNGVSVSADGTISVQGGNANIIECGPNKTYTRLRDACAAALLVPNSTVIVYPDTYDLTQEFATEIASHGSTQDVGISVGNGMNLIFLQGSKVTAIFNTLSSDTDWKYVHFNPIRTCGGNATIIGLDIHCKNTRYCVHDDASFWADESLKTQPYTIKYLSCNMYYETNASPVHYFECIGGGLGAKATILVQGGTYKTYSANLPASLVHYPTIYDLQQAITYHNMGGNSSAQSYIEIRDVYCYDRGYFRFGNYGPSTLKTKVLITGCRMDRPTLLMNEGWTPDSQQAQNFEIIEYNNEVSGMYPIFKNYGLVNPNSSPNPSIDLPDLNTMRTGIITFYSTGTPPGLTDKVSYAGGCMLITMRHNDNPNVFEPYDWQLGITAKCHIKREYDNGQWGPWIATGTLNVL